MRTMQQSTVWQRSATIITTAVTALFGFSGFAAADAIITTGPGSTNSISASQDNTCNVSNSNRLNLNSSNSQSAESGSATAAGNTSAGSATTGEASNNNATNATVNVDNSGASLACVCEAAPAPVAANNTISNTGPQSHNSISTSSETTTNVTNSNTVNISNNTNSENEGSNQNATTGDAVVTDNTSGGSASTGDASNSNQSDFVVNLVNGADAGIAAAVNNNFNDACATNTAPTVSNNFGGLGGGSLTPSSAPLVTSALFRPSSPRSTGSGYGGGSSRYYATPVISRSSAPAPQVTNCPPAAVTPVSSQQSSAPVTAVARTAPAPVTSTISNTGPGSDNSISNNNSSSTTVSNTNNVSVSNNNNQSSSTGSAVVTDNTTGGSATTGTASNYDAAISNTYVSN